MTPRPQDSSAAASRTPWAFLLVISVGALALRSAFSYEFVITPDRVNLQDNDAWYHMRLIDHITANWPARLTRDPFVLPGGQHVPVAPLFDLLVSSVAMAAGLGAPSPRTTELAAAWAPAVLGALAPLLVFAAGRRLFDARAGVMGAALVAIMPGHLLDRSRLGYADHHVLEALFAMTCFWLLIRGLQQQTTRARLIAATWSGFALAAYLLSWASGSFLIFILALWLVVQYVVDACLARPASDAGRVAAVTALIALPLVYLLQERTHQFQLQMLSLATLAAGGVGMDSIRMALARMGLSSRWLPAGLVLALVAGWIVMRTVAPAQLTAVMAEIERLRPDATSFTVVETMPLTAFAAMPWTRVNPFMVLGTGLPLGAIGLALLIAGTVRDQRADWILLLVWTTVVLAATLLSNRFGYYLVPMLALMGGWVCARLLGLVPGQGLKRDVIAASIGVLAFAPNLWPAHRQVRADTGPPADWVTALEWLRHETPPPFDRPEFYHSPYDGQSARLLPAYSVMAWWDYGYWITRSARRVPIANPTQAGAALAGEILTETAPARARGLLDTAGARYLVLDGQLPFRLVAPPVHVMGKFQAMVTWGARRAEDYYEAMYTRDQAGMLRPALVFHPAYYETLVNRLYMFDARAVEPARSSVITFAERVGAGGTAYREIVDVRTFPSFAQADAHLTSLGRGPHRLVGLRPDESPVPLEALPDFRRVWAAAQAGPWPDRSSIVIFERSPGGGVPPPMTP